MNEKSFIINEKVLFGYHSFEGIVAKKDWEKIKNEVERYKKNEVKIRFFDKNPDFLHQFEQIKDLLDNLPSRSALNYFSGRDVLGVYSIRSFISSFEKNSGFPQKEWDNTLAFEIMQKAPNFLDILQGLKTHAEKNMPSVGHIVPSSLPRAALQHQNIQSGLWRVQDCSEDFALDKITQGEAVAVYSKGNGYLSGNGRFVPSICEARLYESVAAARRSVKAYSTSYRRGDSFNNCAYVRTHVAVTEILECDGTIDPILRSVGIVLTRTRMKKELEQGSENATAENPSPSPSKSRKL